MNKDVQAKIGMLFRELFRGNIMLLKTIEWSKYLRNLCLLPIATLCLSACVYNDGYSGYNLSHSEDEYCDPYNEYASYYDCDVEYGFANIGYDGGWHQNYYYPGFGFFIFDRAGSRFHMSDFQRSYWGSRRHQFFRTRFSDKRFSGRRLRRYRHQRARREGGIADTPYANRRRDRRVEYKNRDIERSRRERNSDDWPAENRRERRAERRQERRSENRQERRQERRSDRRQNRRDGRQATRRGDNRDGARQNRGGQNQRGRNRGDSAQNNRRPPVARAPSNRRPASRPAQRASKIRPPKPNRPIRNNNQRRTPHKTIPQDD